MESETFIHGKNIQRHVVIAHPPEKNDSLSSKVLEYCNSKLNICKKTSDYKISIFFYKETSDTPRDFISTDDDCNFGSEYIGCHIDDIICVLKSNYNNQNQLEIELELRKGVDYDWEYKEMLMDCAK